MVKKGLRNSLLLAIAPTATIASIVRLVTRRSSRRSRTCSSARPSPASSSRSTSTWCFELKKLGLWNEEMRNRIKMADGSIQDIAEIPENVRAVFRTVWEVPQRSLIDMAADRGAYIDQSQSLNLFMESPNIGKLSSMYMYAWKRG